MLDVITLGLFALAALFWYQAVKQQQALDADYPPTLDPLTIKGNHRRRGQKVVSWWRGGAIFATVLLVLLILLRVFVWNA